MENQSQQEKIPQPTKPIINNQKDYKPLQIQTIDLKCKEWNLIFQMKLSWSNTSSTVNQRKLQKNFNKIKRMKLTMFNSDNMLIVENSLLKLFVKYNNFIHL
jgi:hypothetical protein